MAGILRRFARLPAVPVVVRVGENGTNTRHRSEHLTDTATGRDPRELYRKGAEIASDPDAIVEIGRSVTDEVEHTVIDNADAIFTWDYGRSRAALVKLYEKAKSSQWNASTDLDWSTPVDIEKVAMSMGGWGGARERFGGSGGVLGSWGDAEWMTYGIESQKNTLSQFLHGEQGALICTAKIVESVPWIDAKYYASTQVMDEARHVEVFGRYLDEKLEGHYPINPHLRVLLDDIIADHRWDITYLGMQIMVEGLALAAFGAMHHMCDEPLLRKLLRYVMSDEARHVAFGVLSLKEIYDDMSASEIRQRQEFAYDAAVRLRNRWFHTDIWERMGADPNRIVAEMIDNPHRHELQFRSLLFSKIVPNCKKLGLLDAGDGWLRQKFTELGIIEFEDFVDTGEEYEMLDEVAKDRQAAASA
ncbi:MAG TPA: ferritin-like domain-containing protein [Acidimicrobiales bacterium]